MTGRSSVDRREAAHGRLAELCALDETIVNGEIRGEPEEQGPAQPAVHIEPDRPVRGGLGDVVEVNLDPRRAASRPARAPVVVRVDERVVEVGVAEGERLAASDGRCPSLELVEGNEDPSP